MEEAKKSTRENNRNQIKTRVTRWATSDRTDWRHGEQGWLGRV